MKKLLILTLIMGALWSSRAQETPTDAEPVVTTYYLIRHAEKDRSDKTNRNPGLTKKGFFRAERWAGLFETTQLDAVYSTNYDRTLMTASPTAMAKELEIQLYDPRELNSPAFQEATIGKTVLVVGHSNTTPAFVNAIIGAEKFPDMSDSDNMSLYVVTLIGDQSSVQVLKVK